MPARNSTSSPTGAAQFAPPLRRTGLVAANEAGFADPDEDGRPRSARASPEDGRDLRVLIADPHAIVRKGVRVVVEAHSAWRVCAEAADGPHALELAARERPDIVVLAVSLPLVDGIAVARRLLVTFPGMRVLFFTSHGEEDLIKEALAAGARGYVLKSDASEHLGAALSAMAANRLYFSPVVTELLLETAFRTRATRAGFSTFTSREIEVTKLISRGRSSHEIARILGVCVKTVGCHRNAAMRKAGVRSGAGLVRFAIRQRLIEVSGA